MKRSFFIGDLVNVMYPNMFGGNMGIIISISESLYFPNLKLYHVDIFDMSLEIPFEHQDLILIQSL
jgi:hypothetical protein